MFLYQIVACLYMGNKIKKMFKNNTFKISGPTWIEKFELHDGSLIYQIFNIISKLSPKTSNNS